MNCANEVCRQEAFAPQVPWPTTIMARMSTDQEIRELRIPLCPSCYGILRQAMVASFGKEEPWPRPSIS
jgi:NAD-dependent SIR2 family protein deacetylase